MKAIKKYLLLFSVCSIYNFYIFSSDVFIVKYLKESPSGELFFGVARYTKTDTHKKGTEKDYPKILSPHIVVLNEKNEEDVEDKYKNKICIDLLKFLQHDPDHNYYE